MKKIIFAVLLLISFSATSLHAALKPNDVAPDVSLRDGAGKVFSLSDVAGPKRKEGGKGVVLSFFASWCVPCRIELPIFNSLVDELKGKGIKVVLVNFKEDWQVIRSMLLELKVDKPVVLADLAGKTVEKYQVRFLPTTFFIGADGKIKDIIFGEIRDKQELREKAGKLLGK